MIGRLLYGKWEYLGWSQLYYMGPDHKADHNRLAGVVHFYARVKNQKKRRFHYSLRMPQTKLETKTWYNHSIVPWLEGADMWKPIDHPVAVRGTLINHMTKTPTP